MVRKILKQYDVYYKTLSIQVFHLKDSQTNFYFNYSLMRLTVLMKMPLGLNIAIVGKNIALSFVKNQSGNTSNGMGTQVCGMKIRHLVSNVLRFDIGRIRSFKKIFMILHTGLLWVPICFKVEPSPPPPSKEVPNCELDLVSNVF